jgi:hypothetical protein
MGSAVLRETFWRWYPSIPARGDHVVRLAEPP